MNGKHTEHCILHLSDDSFVVSLFRVSVGGGQMNTVVPSLVAVFPSRSLFQQYLTRVVLLTLNSPPLPWPGHHASFQSSTL